MEPTDAVKLIYQNEFGGGHLIRNEEVVMAYLRREYESVVHDLSIVKTEPIGNGILRVNLGALEQSEVEQLGRDFIRSAELHRGSAEQFLDKLTLLRRLAEEGVFAFSVEELEKYLTEYRKRGYPAVSHSEAYRKAYNPAYRIVLEDTE